MGRKDKRRFERDSFKRLTVLLNRHFVLEKWYRGLTQADRDALLSEGHEVPGYNKTFRMIVDVEGEIRTLVRERKRLSLPDVYIGEGEKDKGKVLRHG